MNNTIETIRRLLTVDENGLLPCFCGGLPQDGMGYNYGKVTCEVYNCRAKGTYVYPDKWSENRAYVPALRELLDVIKRQALVLEHYKELHDDGTGRITNEGLHAKASLTHSAPYVTLAKEIL